MSETAIASAESELTHQLTGELAEFTELADFDGFEVLGIFDKHAEIAGTERGDKGGVQEASTAPRFWTKARPEGAVKDTPVVIRGDNYAVIRIDPDKNGGHFIWLRSA